MRLEAKTLVKMKTAEVIVLITRSEFEAFRDAMEKFHHKAALRAGDD